MKTSIANEDRFPSARNLFPSLILMVFSLELLFPENYKVLLYNSRFSLRCPTKCCFGGDYALLWSLGAMFFLIPFAGECGDSGIQPWLCAQLLQNVVVQLLSHQELPFLISWLSTLAANGAANQDTVLSFWLWEQQLQMWFRLCMKKHAGHGLCCAPKPLPPSTETRDRY